MRSRVDEILGEKPLIGVVHLAPLPGAPRWTLPPEDIYARAAEDAVNLVKGGFGAVLVENYGDAPFLPGSVGPETVAAMAVAVREVSAAVDVPVGVNVLRSDPLSALAVCVAAGGRFLRVNVHCGATVTDQGILEGTAHATLRERARLLAEDVAILADVHVKHGRPLGGGSLEEATHDVVKRGLADAVLVSGTRTGGAADLGDVRAAKKAAGEIPVLVASGVTANTVAETLAAADGVIVSTALESARPDGTARIDLGKAGRFVEAARAVS